MQDNIIAVVVSLLLAVIAMLPNYWAKNSSDTSQAVIGRLEQAINLLQQAPSQARSETLLLGRVPVQPDTGTGQLSSKDTNADNSSARTVPEINAIAAPAALALLTGGLLLFRERLRHARQVGGQSKPKFSNLAA